MDNDLHFVSPGINAEIKSLQQIQMSLNDVHFEVIRASFTFTFTLLNRKHAFILNRKQLKNAKVCFA